MPSFRSVTGGKYRLCARHCRVIVWKWHQLSCRTKCLGHEVTSTSSREKNIIFIFQVWMAGIDLWSCFPDMCSRCCCVIVHPSWRNGKGPVRRWGAGAVVLGVHCNHLTPPPPQQINTILRLSHMFHLVPYKVLSSYFPSFLQCCAIIHIRHQLQSSEFSISYTIHSCVARFWPFCLPP